MQQHLAHLFPTPKGIALAGVILAKRSPNGTFNIRGREKEIHAQLQAAYGKAVTPQAMRYVERGCELLAKVSDQELEQAAYPFHPNPDAKTTSGNDFSDLTKGLMMFALTGLNDMENVPEGKARLLKMQASIHHDSLLKSYGLPTWAQLTKDDGDDEEDDEDDEDDDNDDSGTSAGGGNSHYNPDEPRIPAGQPGGGQWTTAGNGVSSDSGSISADDIRTALREDFDNYNPSALPQGTQVADSGQFGTDVNVNNGSSQNSVNTISTGIQTNDYGFIRPVNTAIDTTTGNPANQVNIFIGGALDQSVFGNVKDSDSLNYSLGSNYYFTHSDEEKINDFIDNLPDDTTINVIGHSWGGDTAARVALDNPDAIDNLITIDPVSTFHPRPDLSQVANSVGNWVNVDATGHGGPFAGFTNGNVAAGFGAWNDAPNGIANSFITADYPHAYFSNMLNAKDSKSNQSPQNVIGIGTPTK